MKLANNFFASNRPDRPVFGCGRGSRVVNRDVKGGSVVRAKTLAVVVGIAACTMTLAVAGADRFIHHTTVVLGFDDAQFAATDRKSVV